MAVEQVTTDDRRAIGDRPDPLDAANNKIREAAKWLVASAAAVGVAMLAGSQLSRIGELDAGWPTSVDRARLWIAFLGVIAGLGSVVYVIWTAVQIMLPKLILVRDLVDMWDSPPKALAPVVAQFRRNPKYLQGYETPAAIVEKRDQLLIAQREASDEQVGRERRAAVQDRLIDIDARIEAVEDIATHEALRAQFTLALRKLLVATGAIAVSIVGFAWAANPPPKTPAADLSNARLIGSYLRDADLRNAKLDHADFTNADLTGADLSGASIVGVTWRNTTCPDGTNSDADKGTCAGHLT